MTVTNMHLRLSMQYQQVNIVMSFLVTERCGDVNKQTFNTRALISTNSFKLHTKTHL